ncbi:nucleotide disphospho-sugar-binding domain-containing protein [Pseudonocardia nantongensis]|uniref:nucleotide disphospho-sugar-binding domain-containing protein n=1 Tax=Pseudonocardia nantongensis TaxID=1181885 RepID=UPI00397DC096
MMLRSGSYLRKQGIRDVRASSKGRPRPGGRSRSRERSSPGGTFEGYRFVGPVLGDRSLDAGWAPPPGGRPVLLVSLGSACNDRPDPYRAIVSTAGDRPWHVVLSIGDVDPAGIGALPPNVEVYAQVPQPTVLRHARVLVIHAGKGGTTEGLVARVPLVAFPQMAEQRANADRIAGRGLGRVLDPATVTAEQLWAAVEAVADDPKVSVRLGWMAGEIAVAGGAHAAADEIEAALR